MENYSISGTVVAESLPDAAQKVMLALEAQRDDVEANTENIRGCTSLSLVYKQRDGGVLVEVVITTPKQDEIILTTERGFSHE